MIMASVRVWGGQAIAQFVGLMGIHSNVMLPCLLRVVELYLQAA